MKWFYRINIWSLLIIHFFFSNIVWAESKTATVYTQLSDQEILEILDFRNDIDISIKNKGIIAFKHGDVRYVIQNDNNGVLLFSGFPSQKVSLSDINKWNSKKQFVSAYLKEDNTAVLYAKLALHGGVTEYNLKLFASVFFTSAGLFSSIHQE